jgi:hypothetical protein
MDLGGLLESTLRPQQHRVTMPVQIEFMYRGSLQLVDQVFPEAWVCPEGPTIDCPREWQVMLR